MGELSGKRTGSSIEYQDRRDYVPGDDIRYIDWRAFARTDRLSVKLYREEITPVVDIIVDTSLSMAVTPEKALRRMDLSHLFFLLARKLNAATTIYDLTGNLRRIRNPLELMQTEGRPQVNPLPLLREAPLSRRGGIKLFVSDFLFPFSPPDLVSVFSEADRLVLVQVLSSFEADPGQGGFVRLVDAEKEDFLDVSLTRSTVEGYQNRLRRLQDDLERRVRVVQGAFAIIRDHDSPDDMIRRLVLASVLEP